MKKDFFKKAWYFIWKDNSVLSWIVNLILAFILVKFLIYPGLGLLLGTTHPLVAVVSGSMEHDVSFNQWWEQNKGWYEPRGISKQNFIDFKFTNGFNKGDIMVLTGGNVEVGDVIVYPSNPDPIIHRVYFIGRDEDGMYYMTKGDHNAIDDAVKIRTVIGQAGLRIPLLGYIKIWASQLVGVL